MAALPPNSSLAMGMPEANVFLEPQTVAPVPVAQVVVPSNIHVAKTGQAAPYAGRWLVENDLQASVTLAQGEPLPQHNGRVVRWVLAES